MLEEQNKIYVEQLTEAQKQIDDLSSENERLKLALQTNASMSSFSLLGGNPLMPTTDINDINNSNNNENDDTPGDDNNNNPKKIEELQNQIEYLQQSKMTILQATAEETDRLRYSNIIFNL